MLEARGLVWWGREGWPGSPADDKGDALELADETVVAILQQLSDLDVLGVVRYPSPESYAVGEVSACGLTSRRVPAVEARPPRVVGKWCRLWPALSRSVGPRWAGPGGTLREALRVG